MFVKMIKLLHIITAQRRVVRCSTCNSEVSVWKIEAYHWLCSSYHMPFVYSTYAIRVQYLRHSCTVPTPFVYSTYAIREQYQIGRAHV